MILRIPVDMIYHKRLTMHQGTRLALNNITAGVREAKDANRTSVAGHLDEIQGCCGNYSERISEVLARRVLRIFGRTGFKEQHDIVYDKIIEAGCLWYAHGFDMQDILFLQNIWRDEQ